jgi:ABC-type branched-subunit amino acid transport system ATPase component
VPPLLELRDVRARYGPVPALQGVALRVDEGEIVAVLGANGAGKTTTLRAISGTVRRSGEVLFAGRPIGRTPEAVARSRIAHVPEGLLDEPSLGLAPIVVRELFRIIRALNEEEGLAVLVVEQNALIALEAAHRAYVLEAGRVALEGASSELRENESVRRSYLGY